MNFVAMPPVRTIILSTMENTSKSAPLFPPESVQEVLIFLRELATSPSLKKYSGELVF